MLDQVEVTVAEQPLPRLQAVGSTDTVFPFLYELGWGRGSRSVARLRRTVPAVRRSGCCLGLAMNSSGSGHSVRPLVELHWTKMVAEINGVATAELELHRRLFGSDRLIPPKALREGIAALQGNRCFYCRGTLGGAPQADHFIPRIRCGIDAVENLVLADRRCNNDKRDLLPGPPHVTAWARRNQRYSEALAELAEPAGGTPTLRRPSRLPGRSTATCPTVAPCYGWGSRTSATPIRPQS